MELIVQYLKTFGWGVTGAITMAVSLWILLKVFSSTNQPVAIYPAPKERSARRHPRSLPTP